MGFLLRTKISPTKNQQQNDKKLTYTNKFQCFLTSAIWPWELNLLYCYYYPLYKIWCELIWWYTTIPPRNIHFPKIFEICKKRKSILGNVLQAFSAEKKRTKNFTVQNDAVEWTYGHFLAIFSTKNLQHIFGIIRIFSVLFNRFKPHFKKKKNRKKLQKVWYFFCLLISFLL